MELPALLSWSVITGGPVTLELLDGAVAEEDEEVLVVGDAVVVGVVTAHNCAMVAAANWS